MLKIGYTFLSHIQNMANPTFQKAMLTLQSQFH